MVTTPDYLHSHSLVLRARLALGMHQRKGADASCCGPSRKVAIRPVCCRHHHGHRHCYVLSSATTIAVVALVAFAVVAVGFRMIVAILFFCLFLCFFRWYHPGQGSSGWRASSGSRGSRRRTGRAGPGRAGPSCRWQQPEQKKQKNEEDKQKTK